MEHPINRSFDAAENDPSLSVTALAVVLALIFGFCFTVRAALPELPLLVHHALANVPSSSEGAAQELREIEAAFQGGRMNGFKCHRLARTDNS